MCGIAGIHRRTNKKVPSMGKLADELLLASEDRGWQSSGFVAIHDDGRVQLDRKTQRASRYIERRPRFSADSRTVMLHTRFATVGAVTVENAQPQASGKVAAVHNGTIWNADELFAAFKLPRRAEVDSEIVPALIDHAGWDHVGDALELTRGGAAVGVVNVDHPRELVLARTASYPMVYLVTKDLVIWASTEQAIVDALFYTYGVTDLPGSTWGRLPEWSMLRFAPRKAPAFTRLTSPMPDELIPARRAQPTRRARAWTAPAHGNASTTKTTQTTGSKRSKRRAKKGGNGSRPVKGTERPAEQLRVAVAPEGSPIDRVLEREPWMEEEVHKLMLEQGLDYEQAFEEVYGVSIGSSLWSDLDDELSRVLAAERG